MTNPKDKVVSFAMTVEGKRELLKIKNHTLFIKAVVAASLGRCPVCDNEWPKGIESEETVSETPENIGG